MEMMMAHQFSSGASTTSSKNLRCLDSSPDQHLQRNVVVFGLPKTVYGCYPSRHELSSVVELERRSATKYFVAAFLLPVRASQACCHCWTRTGKT